MSADYPPGVNNTWYPAKDWKRDIDDEITIAASLEEDG